MAKYILNYASIDGDGELYCECLGMFEDEASALQERNNSIELDKEGYEEEFYNSHIVKNTNTLYEWSDDEITQGLSIGFLDGAVWADKNPHSQYITEYLCKEKGYPISLNGEIPTFEETMKNVQIYNDYKAKQWLEKACNWLKEQKELIGISFQEDFIERFKIAMKTDHKNSSELVNKHSANVWHNISEKPELNQYFLAQIGDNAFNTFIMHMDENKDWRKWCEGMNIKMWAHINDLLPKGGLK